MATTLSAADFKKKYGQQAADQFQVGQTISADQFQQLSGKNTPPQGSSNGLSNFADKATKIADMTVGGGQLMRGTGIGLSAFTKTGKASSEAQQNLLDQTNKLVQSAAKLPKDNPRKKQLLDLAQKNYQQLGLDAQQFLDDSPTAKQVLGSALQLGVSAVGAKAPVGGSLKAKVGLAGLQGLGSGAAIGYGNSSSPGLGITGQDAGTIGRTAALTGVTSAGMTGLLGLAGKGIGQLTNRAPKKLYDISLPLRATEEEKILYGRMNNPSETLLKEGVTGNRAQVFQKSGEKVNSLGAQLRALLKSQSQEPNLDAINAVQATANVNTPEGLAALEKVGKKFVTGGKLDVSQHAPILEDLLNSNKAYLKPDVQSALIAGTSGKVTPSQANTIREYLGSLIPQGKWNAGSIQESAKMDALKGIYGDLRGQIGPKGSEADTLLKQIQAYLVTRNNTGKTLAREGSSSVPLTRLLSIGGNVGLGGGAFVAEETGHKNTAKALLGGLALKTVMTNPAIATRLAQLLSKTGGALNNVDASTKTQATKQLLKILQSNLLGHALSKK